ncbi:MAG: hypothetical protein ACRYFU_25150 [Janthinobacterium lividum]
MAMQTTPHTETQQDVNSDQTDLEPNMQPQDMGRGEDAKTYEIADGAQTAGNRSFHSTDGRDNQPKSLDEGTANTPSRHSQVPTEGGTGITSSGPAKERETQEKVIGK